jgi:hypothetical protein
MLNTEFRILVLLRVDSQDASWKALSNEVFGVDHPMSLPMEK